MKKILEVKNLKKHFLIPNPKLFAPDEALKAVNDVTFDVYAGETLGIVGESGCGKSTLGRTILQVLKPTGGDVIYHQPDVDNHLDDSINLSELKKKDLIIARKEMQIIFQDPLASLNPRMTIGEIIGEPLLLYRKHMNKKEREEEVLQWMERVGLLRGMYNRYPHEFSGGQCQRIGIARAMILGPKIIVCDEAVSALDVSIQAQVVNLLQSLQQKFNTTFLFISHDLSVVRYISDRILVLYLGKVMEIASKDQIYNTSRHPYTKALISAVPIPNPKLERERERFDLKGEIPSQIHPPSGCVFRTRCPYADDLCSQKTPQTEEVEPGHFISCHHWKKH